MIKIAFFLIIFVASPGWAKLIFREDFKVAEAHIPVTSADLTAAPFLSLERHGEGAGQYKFSHHPEVENDPHYVWNGLTTGPTLLSFPFAKPVDLSNEGAMLRLETKNSATSRLHLALKTKAGWIVVDQGVGAKPKWTARRIVFSKSRWRKFDLEKLTPGPPLATPDLSSVSALAFFNPVTPNKSKDCTRLNWFELHDSPAKTTRKTPKKTTQDTALFWEESQPFLRSALIAGPTNRTRRGVLIRLGHGLFTCFDPDLLRYSAVWKAPAGQLPLTLDSMAGVSYPDKKAKASRPPQLQGTLLSSTPELPGAGLKELPDSDPRTARLISSDDPVGPLPPKQGRWSGLSISGASVILNYQIGSTKIRETTLARSPDTLERLIQVSASKETLTIRTHNFPHQKATFPAGVTLRNKALNISPSSTPRLIRIISSTAPLKNLPATSFPETLPTNNPFPGSVTISSPNSQPSTPFEIRNLALPRENPWQRPLRPTDIAFLSNGEALLTTLDGDLWRIKNIDHASATWTRAAAGFYEPIALETNEHDEVFVLGRDQVTQVIDTNQDGTFDHFRCASDAFQQTLHPRDFASSLALEPDGSFLIGKGGLASNKPKPHEEMSGHRGTILRLSPDGQSATVLADGLRIPYVGRNSSGQIFASDQQGNFVPSTPIHVLDSALPNYGFEPTDHRKTALSRPLLWLPYRANRSAAAFTTFPDKAFPDLAGQFANVSWDGRLFTIHPESAFAVRLPLQLKFPSLNAAANPTNGKLYAVGLGISGYKPQTTELLGLAEISQNAPLPLPASFEVSSHKTSLTFSKPLPGTLSPTAHPPVLTAWNIERSPNYGSGHFKWNGKAGEQIITSKATLSPDRKTLTLETSPVFKSSILRLQLHLTDTSRKTNGIPLEIYTTPKHLPNPNSDELAILNKEDQSISLQPGDSSKGEAIFTQYACAGCHSLADEKLVGPSLRSLASRHKESFLRESILNPAKDIAEGYPPAMPSFAGVIPPQELEDLIAFLKTLD